MRDLWREPGPFTVAELAAAARVSQGLVRKAISAGALRVCRAGRCIRIGASEARRWAREVGAEPHDVLSRVVSRMS